MALNYKSIDYSENDFLIRLDSKYYNLQEYLNHSSSFSEIDFIPFGDFIDNITDGEHAGQTFVKEGVLFLKNSSIKDFDISLDDGFYISEIKHKKLQRSALKSEDVLFTTIGHLGSAAIVPEHFCEANMNQNFVKISINKEKVSPYYIVAYLNSKLARKQISCLLTGNIQSILTYPKIKNIKIGIPKDDSIQKEITEKYKNAIKLSQEARKIIKETIKYLDNELQLINNDENYDKVFSVKHDLLNNECGLWIPKYFWPKYVETEENLMNRIQCIPLGEIATLKKGDEPGSDFYIDYLDKIDTDVPFIRTSDIYNYQIDSSPDNFIDIHTFEEINQDIKEGDILFTKDGKIGEIALVTNTDKAIYSSGIDRIRINKMGKSLGITPEYLFNIVACNKVGKYTADRYTVTAATIPHLKEDFIRKMKIPILSEDKIKVITEKTKMAFEMIDKKKKIILECQDIVNKICKEAK